MCGRFSCFTPLEALRERFDAEAPDEPVYPRYNAAPGQKMIVIPMDDPHKMHFSKWGLIPHWAKDPKIGIQVNQRPIGNPEGKTCLSGIASEGTMPGSGGWLL